MPDRLKNVINHESVVRATGESVITIVCTHADELFAHALAVLPEECCGLVGGKGYISTSVYPLQNTARDPQARYEARPEDLFAAQKTMRARGEELLAIYHSHPHDAEPEPSETDVRLAYYPEVIYLIIGFDKHRPVLRGFRISSVKRSWGAAGFRIV